MMDGYYPHRSGVALLMVLGMLAIWALVGLAIVWLIRSIRSAQPTQTPPKAQSEGAEQILAERLARGEIDIEDYRARLAALKAPG